MRSPALDFLYNTLNNNNTFLLYSHVHLIEIEQIPKYEFITEHLDLLSELRAIYLKPGNQKFDTRDPHTIWDEFLNNKQESSDLWNGNPAEALEKISRKLSGLPVGETFYELNQLNRDIVKSLLENIERELNDLDQDTLKSLEPNEIITYTNLLNEIRQKSETSQPLDIPEDGPLGPQIFRRWLHKKGLSFSDIKPRDVIPCIMDVLALETQSGEITPPLDGNIQSRIVHCYNLMNWAGYYPDDFTSQKKQRDR